MLIDYGFPQNEYYHPQRSERHLMGHYRHRAHADPFLWPGLTDLTAHVDFTAMAQAGERGGLARRGLYVAGRVPGLAPASSSALRPWATRRRRATCGKPPRCSDLLSPAEMGELFEVWCWPERDGIVAPYFALADRTHRL